ncbi:hypothetical protein P8452_64237 [Trifolium repens]|nr:hypothetical protein P8452_64237 [Trifolium repens]
MDNLLKGCEGNEAVAKKNQWYSDYDRVQLESLKPDLMCSLDITKKFIGWNKLSNEFVYVTIILFSLFLVSSQIPLIQTLIPSLIPYTQIPSLIPSNQISSLIGCGALVLLPVGLKKKE